MAQILKFIYSQRFLTLPYPDEDCTGKTIMVTGANSGLGLEAARHFTRLNASKVILCCRSIDKGNAAKASIEESSKRKGVVEVWQLDLGSYESVKQLVQRTQTLQRLDAVVENAGIAGSKIWEVYEDNEATITVNVISTFLLALLILPKLRETAMKFNSQPNLVIVSSEVHAFAKFEERKDRGFLTKMSDKKEANMGERYQVSKLLEVFYTRELAARTKADGKPQVTINLVNPGLCHSELSKREGSMVLDILKFLLARTTEAGSRTLVHAAGTGEETHGQYLSDCNIASPSPMVLNEPQTQKLVWDEISEKLESIQPGILANV